MQSGQALVALLVVAVMASVIVGGAVAMSAINARTTAKFAMSEESQKTAEAGAEKAILQLLRDPNYAGETLTVGNGTATITVSGTTTKTVVSQGVSGNFFRKIQVIGAYANNAFTVVSWSEID